MNNITAGEKIMTSISTTQSISPVSQGFVDFLRQYRDRLTLDQPGSVSNEEFGEWMDQAESNRQMVAKALSSFSKSELTNFVKIYLGIDELETLGAKAVNCRLGGYGSTNDEKLSHPDDLPGIVWSKAAREHYQRRQKIELESTTRTLSPDVGDLNSDKEKPEDANGISPDASTPTPEVVSEKPSDLPAEKENSEILEEEAIVRTQNNPIPESVVPITPIELVMHHCRVENNPERFKTRRVAFDPKDPTGFGVDENGSPRFDDGGVSLELLRVPRDQKDSYKDFEKVMQQIVARKMERNVVMAFVRGFLQENFPQEVALASRPAPDGN